MDRLYRIGFNAMFSAILFMIFAGYGTVSMIPTGGLGAFGLWVGGIVAFFVASIIGNLFIRIANLAEAYENLSELNPSIVVYKVLWLSFIDSLFRGLFLGSVVCSGLIYGAQRLDFWYPKNGLSTPVAIAVQILAMATVFGFILSGGELPDMILSKLPVEKKKRQQTEQQIDWTIQPEQQHEKYHFSDEHLHRGIRR